MYYREYQRGLGQLWKAKSSVYVCVCLCMLVCLSPGQGDTGISRDELLIEEAVIEVFKKVRGD